MYRYQIITNYSIPSNVLIVHYLLFVTIVYSNIASNLLLIYHYKKN